MIFSNLVQNIEASLLKRCKEVAIEASLSGFDIFNFDAHSVINDLPDKDLIGISELSITDHGGTLFVKSMIVISTKNDDNGIKRCRNAANLLFEAFMSDIQFKAVSATTGNDFGVLTIRPGTTLLPVGSTKSRPLQIIAVELAFAGLQ